jgi:SIR2-like domain
LVILEPREIPYGDLIGDLFKEEPAQKIIPFLGAGVSISAKTSPADNGRRALSQDPRIREAMDHLSRPGASYLDENGNSRVTLDETTRLYAEIGLEMAFLLQQMRDAPVSDNDASLLDRLKDDVYPPSGGDLVEWLSQSASYGPFDDVLSRVSTKLRRRVDEPSRTDLLALLRSVAGLAGVSPAPLSSLSAFFEAVRHRTTLLDRLGEILRNKERPTPTHEVVARAAHWHLKPRRKMKSGRALPPGQGHYLIMTTNYDCLVEHALHIPYVVLTMGQKDFMVRARFGNMSDTAQRAFMNANPPRRPGLFTLEQPTPASQDIAGGTDSPARLAIIYKVHGCISDWANGRNDSIVISDNDYVTNISRFSDNDGVIPACVTEILSSAERPYFLFMGYSLRDWNVRGMLRAVRSKRAGVGHEDEDYGDYTVVRNFGRLEEAFFTQHNIRIIHEDLMNFSAAVSKQVQDRYDG